MNKTFKHQNAVLFFITLFIRAFVYLLHYVSCVVMTTHRRVAPDHSEVYIDLMQLKRVFK